jgi:hypothetical protein
VNAEDYLQSLSEKLIGIIEASDDPAALMRQIAREAEQAEIVRFASDMRMTEPWIFAMDLLTENPSAYEWAQTARVQWPLTNVHDAETLLETFPKF